MVSATELASQASRLELPAMSGVDDTALMGLQSTLSGIRRSVDAAAAEVAAEIARRSSRELGYGGLAQRVGARTPEKLVQRLTGSSFRDARVLVDAGRMLAEQESDEREAAPSVLADAIRTGRISIEQARAIELGLGSASAAVPDDRLDPARTALIGLAPSVFVEELRAHARVLRDELDSAGVADRERELRERRFLRLFPQEDGMTRLVGLLDPESAARVQTVFDAALSPRRGGPRFVDDRDRERAERITDDPRTDDQLALDTVLALLDAGTGSDTESGGQLLGRGGAPVHVLVAARDLASGSGFARIAGQERAVSIATAERAVCAGGALPVMFDRTGARVLRLGREQRRFSRKQRAALVARDGGCRKCGRPVSQTEAHHIVAWHLGGATDIDNAILLCRFDHLLVHNNGWRSNATCTVTSGSSHRRTSIRCRAGSRRIRRTPSPGDWPADARMVEMMIEDGAFDGGGRRDRTRTRAAGRRTRCPVGTLPLGGARRTPSAPLAARYGERDRRGVRRSRVHSRRAESVVPRAIRMLR